MARDSDTLWTRPEQTFASDATPFRACLTPVPDQGSSQNVSLPLSYYRGRTQGALHHPAEQEGLS